MDAKLLKSFVASVAHIKEIGVDIGPTGRTLTPYNYKKKSKVIEFEQETEDEIDEFDLEEVEDKPNETLGYMIDGLKDNFKLCELHEQGCHELVSNQRIEKRMLIHPHKHWRTKCMNCHRHVHPDGKSMIKSKSGTDVQNVFSAWFKKTRDK
jgi:hypothetical protein